MTTLLNAMQRHDVELGLETMCVGGGQGMAVILAAAELRCVRTPNAERTARIRPLLRRTPARVD